MLHPKSIHHPPYTIHQSNYVISIQATPSQQSELNRSPLFRQHKLLYAENLYEMLNKQADAYMDLMFEEDQDLADGIHVKKTFNAESEWKPGYENENPKSFHVNRPDMKRIESLAGRLPAPVFINSVIHSLSDIHPDLIRINAWPGFLESSLLEAAAGADSIEKGRRIFGDSIVFVKDVPGFVNPRIISMIINEAFYTLEAGTSSREEIDIAMKLGTGYPLGPFEWAEKIGRRRVGALLTALGRGDPMYEVAGSLVDGTW
jgi:3-hydroxybutyryl-CoA dehydrogenase